MSDLSDLQAEADAGLLDFFDLDAWQRMPEQPPINELVRSRPQPVEVWMRSPQNWRPALEENPFPRFVFWQADITRRHLRPAPLLKRLLPPEYPHSWLVVFGDHALLYDSNDPENPTRLPVWKYGDDPANLLRLCNAFADRGWDRIVVGHLKRNVPIARIEKQKFNEWMHRVAASFPHVRLHLTGSHSFSQAFGLNFASADLDPSSSTHLGQVMLPNGRNVNAMSSSQHLKWIHVLGYSATILKTDHFSRVGFNMRSILWASEHWNDEEALQPRHHRLRGDPLGLLGEAKHVTAAPRPRNATLRAHFRPTPDNPDAYPQLSPDPFEPYAYANPVSNAPAVPVRPRVKDNGDKIVCNSCSLANSCRFFREGSVCGLPDTPANELATLFSSRDADRVREGLGNLLANQTERYERARERFKADEESDVMDLKRSEHLMKMENSLIRSAEALVKLLDPSFRQSAIPAVMSSTMHVYNPNVLVADVVKQLEAAGISRDQIDPAKIVDMAKERGMIE